MYSDDRDTLLTEHFKLQKDIIDIQSQIRKLEKTNRFLDQQNRQLRLQLDSLANGTRLKEPEKSRSLFPTIPLSRLLNKEYLVETLNRAAEISSEIYDVASGEIVRHAKCVADEVACKLLPSNLQLNTQRQSSINSNPSLDSLSDMEHAFSSISAISSVMADATANLSSNESSDANPLPSDEEFT
ncbi:hypothetical protein TpMuguga_03g00051 [Theileria parva strain Muguga]|uniref:Uncharacterized protein n=1 Tax=Theileria parva TaxID=5875 RepID=Q4N0R2_THEPA|nr:uncharacterized protein TpMuguga_03g00051 [Theileria parva strain Muguga]EAN30787.1 hypothetical protein TpMuguga_03g00051 [Theileria parva strain Muguga]|eukprot:XP_763070.1 hypothetical protein [Theileria parva strain Muguga]